MSKIILSVLCFIFILNKVIQAAPFAADDNQDIMVASSRLHRGAEQLHYRANPIPDIRNIPSNDFIPHYRRNFNYPIAPEEAEEEDPETVLVNLKVDSAEEPETQYVDLVIDTKRNVNM